MCFWADLRLKLFMVQLRYRPRDSSVGHIVFSFFEDGGFSWRVVREADCGHGSYTWHHVGPDVLIRHYFVERRRSKMHGLRRPRGRSLYLQIGRIFRQKQNMLRPTWHGMSCHERRKHAHKHLNLTCEILSENRRFFANFMKILHCQQKSFSHILTCTVISLSGKFPVHMMLFTLENTNNVGFLKSLLLMSPSYDVTIY